MVGKTASIRQADRDRFEVIKTYCGCLPCLLVGHLNRHTTIEHVTNRGRRLGKDQQHQYTIGLCAFHHFGHSDGGMTNKAMRATYGPSLADGRKVFEAFFGDEIDILLPIQNTLLNLFAANPWPEYDLPREIATDIRFAWNTVLNTEGSA